MRRQTRDCVAAHAEVRDGDIGVDVAFYLRPITKLVEKDVIGDRIEPGFGVAHAAESVEEIVDEIVHVPPVARRTGRVGKTGLRGRSNERRGGTEWLDSCRVRWEAAH